MKTSTYNFPFNTPVIVDDGELKVKGLIKSTYKKKLLVEMSVDDAPQGMSLDAVEAAVQGFDLDHFRNDLRYVPYEINESLVVISVESKIG